MSAKRLLASAAFALLASPALAIGPTAMPAPAPSTTQCDNCSSQDSDGGTNNTQGQSQGSQSGTGVTGPITNPSTPEPAHTQVPSHVPGAGPGGSPKVPG